MRYLTRTPAPLRLLFPKNALWQGPAHTPGPTVYLSFDDGPHPEVTPAVLQLLEAAGAKATFFCVGENVVRYPAVYAMITAAGHAVGNHTYRHRNGWKTPADDYLADVAAAAEVISSPLFRPPYGRICRSQATALGALGYRIVLWDVLSGDFDPGLSPRHCFQNATAGARPGSVLVFHDSAKAAPRLLPALPLVLDFFKEKGWAMKALPL